MSEASPSPKLQQQQTLKPGDICSSSSTSTQQPHRDDKSVSTARELRYSEARAETAPPSPETDASTKNETSTETTTTTTTLGGQQPPQESFREALERIDRQEGGGLLTSPLPNTPGKSHPRRSQLFSDGSTGGGGGMGERADSTITVGGQVIEKLQPFTKVITKAYSLSAPIMAAVLVANLMFLISLGFAGRYMGSAYLGYISVANTLFLVTGFYTGYGMTCSLDMLCTQEFGRDQKSPLLGVYVMRSWALTCFSGIPLFLLWVCSYNLLKYVVPPDAVDPCYDFLSGAIIMYLPSTMSQAASKFLQCQHFTQPIFFASICALLVSYPAHYVLVPLYGVRGLVLAQASAFTVQFLLLVWTMKKMCPDTFLGAFYADREAAEAAIFGENLTDISPGVAPPVIDTPASPNPYSPQLPPPPSAAAGVTHRRTASGASSSVGGVYNPWAAIPKPSRGDLQTLVKEIVLDSKDFMKFIRVSLNAMWATLVEGCSYEMVTLTPVLCGLSTEAIAANGLMITLTFLSFPCQFGVSAGASVLVGNAVGAKKPFAVKRAIVAVMVIAGLQGFIDSFLMQALHGYFFPLFTDDPKVMKMASDNMYAVALSHQMDFIQYVFQGVLRGLGLFSAAGVITVCGQWFTAVPMGFFMVLYMDAGIAGPHQGFMLGASLEIIAFMIKLGPYLEDLKIHLGIEEPEDAIEVVGNLGAKEERAS